MARRRINSIEDIVELTAQLPWWAGVVAAVVSWMALYGVARLTLPTVHEMDAVAPVVVPVLRGLTMAGLYVLPAVFLAAAALSAWLHYKHHKNYADMHSERGRFLLQHLSWREFENLVAEFFRRKGFSVERRGGRLPEGGVDLVASIGEDRYLGRGNQPRSWHCGIRPSSRRRLGGPGDEGSQQCRLRVARLDGRAAAS